MTNKALSAVQMNDSTGERFRAPVGVRLGSCLSPVLFNMMERLALTAELSSSCGLPMTLMHLRRKSWNKRPKPRGYKSFLMLNAAECKISNAHKYKNIKKFGFLGSDKSRMLFLPLINVKMPTIVGILTFMSRKNYMLS